MKNIILIKNLNLTAVIRYTLGFIIGFLAGIIFTVNANSETIKTSYGPVYFSHNAHIEKNIDCMKCHELEKKNKANMLTEKSHNLCRTCHISKGGPVTCAGCHIKK